MTRRSIAVAATLGLVVIGSVVLAAAGPGAAEQQAIPAGNLVKNPGGEANLGGDFHTRNIAPNGWTKGEGAKPYGNPIQVIRYGPDSRYPDVAVARAIGGGRSFFGGGYPSTLSTSFQTIAVSGAASEIDGGGVKACLSAYLGGYRDQPGRARVTVEFLGEDEARLGQVQAGPVVQSHRKAVTTLLRRAVQSAVPRNTRQLRVTITAESGGSSSNYGYADNISVALTRGACEPVLAVRCTGGALVATVTPSDIARTQRVRFQVRGPKGSRVVNDARAPYSARVPMTGLTGRLTVAATVTQAGSGPIVLTKKSRRC
ncbi:MAG TPA: hypothetical protein VMK83_03550 [Gaiellaceae bacterium]|nr:hypothetical protein [Gaiellaceae bacterium]